MGGWQAFFWVLGALVALANLIMALARTPPNDAMSNLAQWAEWVENLIIFRCGCAIEGPNQVAYRWAMATAVIVAFAAMGGYGWLTEQNRPSSERRAPVPSRGYASQPR